MKKGKYSKVLVVLIVSLNLIFTAAVLIVFTKTSSEPTTLVGCWFAFTTTELWALASIKKSKIKKGNGKEASESNENY